LDLALGRLDLVLECSSTKFGACPRVPTNEWCSARAQSIFKPEPVLVCSRGLESTLRVATRRTKKNWQKGEILGRFWVKTTTCVASSKQAEQQGGRTCSWLFSAFKPALV
jgi:hypothetical protein